MLLIVSVFLCITKCTLLQIVNTHKVVGIAITKVLHLSQGSLKHKYRLGRYLEQPRQGGHGVCGEQKAGHELSMLDCNPEATSVLGCNKRHVAGISREMILPLYSALMKLHLECCIQLWEPQHKGMDLLEQTQSGVTRMIRGLEHISCEDGLRDLGLFHVKKRRL